MLLRPPRSTRNDTLFPYTTIFRSHLRVIDAKIETDRLKGGSVMELSALSDFNLVVAQGGFGRASRTSGRPKATLSRHVMELEESLGVRLLERGGRSLRLTDEGRALYERTERLLAEIEEVGEALTAGVSQPRGHPRVSGPDWFPHTLLGQHGRAPV